MIAWDTIEDAVHAWITAGSGLPAGQILWAQQNLARPLAPLVVLRVNSIARVGQDWLTVEPDDADGVLFRSQGQRLLTLSIQVFASTGLGAGSATAMLNQIISAANLPSIHSQLRAAGISVASVTPVLSIDGLINAVSFEPRATVEARCYLASDVVEVGGWIETVQIANGDTGDFTVTAT